MLLALGLGAAVWWWSPVATLGLDDLSTWMEPHRRAWYAMPLVMLLFTTLGLLFVPVLLLIAASGVAFGPVLGPIYAMAGSLASASAGFAIGRWLGLARVQRLGGSRVAAVTHALHRNGTLAVFLARKVPVPFTLTNVVVGATPIRYRDFLVGTVLGMALAVIALAGFGYQLAALVYHPTPRSIAVAALFVAVPLTLAYLINRSLRRGRSVE